MTRHTFTATETREALCAHYKIPVTDTTDFDDGEFIPWVLVGILISVVVAVANTLL